MPGAEPEPLMGRLISVHLFLGAARSRLPLRAAAALPGVVALTLAVALSGCGTSRTEATSDTVPPYYAETIAIQPPAYDSPLNVSGGVPGWARPLGRSP